ncbi:MAG: NAD(P)-dependent alcohol dehydrogenase [Deltaproteobacteria bacterium]|nr:NAD(P)-dependent alcohol dehydrogenase [Deltaproteobacteria bacterium]
MRAIVQTAYGTPTEVLSLADLPVPTVADGDVLIRVRATSVNTPDWAVVSGTPTLMRLGFGWSKPRATVRGTDVAGFVEAVGAGVTEFAVGDAVFGSSLDSVAGTFAELAVVPQGRLLRKPEALSFEEAASMVMSGLTAVRAIRDVAQVRPGMKVLINGASGGVGLLAVQLAVSLGAEVTGVCSGRNAELVLAQGATQVIDYTREDFTESEQRWDVILDNVINHPLRRVMKVLSPTGVVLPNSIGQTTGRLGRVLAGIPRMALAGLMSLFSRRIKLPSITVTTETLQALLDLVEDGAMKVVIDRTYPLDQAPQAVAHMLSHRAAGKVVIAVA